MNFVVPEGSNVTLSQWLSTIINTPSVCKSVGRQSLAAFICWCLWNAQNELYFDHKSADPKEVVFRAEKAFLEYQSSISPLPKRDLLASTQSLVVPHWRPPPSDFFKVNSHAALNQHSQGSGVGFINRDSCGRPKLAVSQPIAFLSPVIGEALALCMALSEALSNGYLNVHVEFDNLELIRMLNQESQEDNVYLLPLLNDIRSIAGNGISVVFDYILRKANQVAHSLAWRAVTCAGRVA
ncbi:hypothetical protein NE237_031021 [Protea cynaroides]|uniref:RNase H type-1 domain-containing protein n=1 Tax=Protea cynaroides TaxID=273540 RepID=A0A9Q0GYZ7_9MAGN|nr:hypothetical protein NE237_031021 [Protea cynaroides]